MNSIFPGWYAALNHHPVFVHFPIVLWLSALLFELISVWRHDDSTHHTAAWLLWLGTASAVLAVLTGLNAQRLVPRGAGHALQVHEQLMLTSFFLAVGLSFFAFVSYHHITHALKVVILVGLLALAVFVTVGADRGAEMVYRYGLGVNWSSALRPK